MLHRAALAALLLLLVALPLRPTAAEEAPAPKDKAAEAFRIYRDTLTRWESAGRPADPSPLCREVEQRKDVFVDAFLAVGFEHWDAVTDGRDIVRVGIRLAVERGLDRYEPAAAVRAFDALAHFEQGRDMADHERRQYADVVLGLGDPAVSVPRLQSLAERTTPADRAYLLRAIALCHATAGDDAAAKAALATACELEAVYGKDRPQVLAGYEHLRDALGRKPKKLVPVSAIGEGRNLLVPRKGTVLVVAELMIDLEIGSETVANLRAALDRVGDERARVVLLVKPLPGLEHRKMHFDFPGKLPSVDADAKTFDDTLARWRDALECPFPLAVLRDDAELPMPRLDVAVYDDEGRLVLETTAAGEARELVFGVRNVLARPGYGSR